MLEKKFYYGQEISEEGLKNGYVDFRTLSKCFDAVLCNDVTKLFYGSINGEYSEVEQVNGFIDNSEEIEELQEELEELEENEEENEERIEELKERIEELEEEQEEQPEIYQYYIVDDNGAELLQRETNEIIYYIESLDLYVWGVTHWGTSWDYVMTDIKIDW